MSSAVSVFIQGNRFISTHSACTLVHAIRRHRESAVCQAHFRNMDTAVSRQDLRPSQGSFLSHTHGVHTQHTYRHVKTGLLLPVSLRQLKWKLQVGFRAGFTQTGFSVLLYTTGIVAKENEERFSAFSSLLFVFLTGPVHITFASTLQRHDAWYVRKAKQCFPVLVTELRPHLLTPSKSSSTSHTLSLRIVKLRRVVHHPHAQRPKSLTDMCALPKSHVKTTVRNYNVPAKVRSIIRGCFHITTL